MFWIIDKSKIYSYIISLSTVVILFATAAFVNNIESDSGNVIETSTNVIQNEINEVNK